MIEITLEAIITRIQNDLYQAAGPSVQLYSETLIAQKISDAFITLANDPETKWKQFRIFNKYTLDGVTGRTTLALNQIFKAFGDIYAIFPDKSTKPLTYLGVRDNPYLIVGNRPIKYIRDTVDIVRVIPAGATGDIIVVGKSVPQPPFLISQIIPFDYIAISNYVCWEYAVDDGSNPAMAEKFRQKFETRYLEIKKEEATEPIQLSGQTGRDVPTHWYSNDVN